MARLSELVSEIATPQPTRQEQHSLTDTTAATEVVEQLPVEAVIPDPGNRKADPNPQFVASVRTHGVIPDAENASRYHLSRASVGCGRSA